MPIKSDNTWLFWAGSAVVLGTFLYLISSMLLPFVVALIVAYFLDPAADKIESFGVSRITATLIITALFFITGATLTIILAPLFYDQLMTLVQKIPEYISLFNSTVVPSFSRFVTKVDPEAADHAKAAVQNASGYVIAFLGQVLGNLWNSGKAVVNVLSLIFITPIVTFYMLRDWDTMISQATKLLPPKYAPVILEQVRAIDRTLSGYLRGQTNVCLILGTFYAVALSLVHLDYALFIGLATGILSFIPYVGVLFGFCVGVTVAYFDYGDLSHVLMVASIFAIGQVLEGAFVTPKLVGDKVGLHPVWIMFGMLAGASIFGFVGVLLAIPVTAVIGVLLRFSLQKYLTSALYLDKKPARSK